MVWVTPIVQSVGMGRAFAQTTSPCTPPISYIAMNVTCESGSFFIKWEGDDFMDPDFEADPRETPDCLFLAFEDAIYGGIPNGNGGLGFVVDPQPDGTYIITVPPGCTVHLVAVKGAHECDIFAPPSGRSFPVSCPGLNPLLSSG